MIRGGSGAQTMPGCVELCNPMDYSVPDSSAHGILLSRILEWVAISSFTRYFQPKDLTHDLMSPALAYEFFTNSTPWEAQYTFLLFLSLT